MKEFRTPLELIAFALHPDSTNSTTTRTLTVRNFCNNKVGAGVLNPFH
jgi:hypothetical protein